MEAWLPAGLLDSLGTHERRGDDAQRQTLVPYFSEQLHLCQIIERMLSTLFTPGPKLDEVRSRTYVDAVDLDLCRWEEALAPTSRWNRWEPSSTPLQPALAAVQ